MARTASNLTLATIRGARVGRQRGGDSAARERVDRVDQPQRQLDILGFFFGAMAGFLDVEISEDAQQSRADFNAIPARQVDQAVQRG